MYPPASRGTQMWSSSTENSGTTTQTRMVGRAAPAESPPSLMGEREEPLSIKFGYQQ